MGSGAGHAPKCPFRLAGRIPGLSDWPHETAALIYYVSAVLPAIGGDEMRWRVLSAGFVVVFSSALAGQQARPPAGPTNAQVPTFKVQAEYVEVDVQVTDQKGSFVRDLKKEDFEVFENGKPQTISAFSVVDLPLEQPDRPIFRSVAIEPDVQSNEHRFDGRVYVVVLDDVHTAFTRTISAKNAVRRFIEQHFHANDLMA